jgi:hypothetical protein
MLTWRGKRFDAFMIQEQSQAALAHITNKTYANAPNNGVFVGHTLLSCTGTTLKRTAQNRRYVQYSQRKKYNPETIALHQILAQCI